jgi:nucleoside-diphosphate-sugar epimerase
VAGTALITGATGLIGAATLEQWAGPDLQPVLLERRRDDLLVPGTARAVVDRVRPDVVIHLAWVASGTPGYRTSADNARWLAATLELAAACVDSGAFLLATGTPLDREPAGADAYSAAKSALWQALSPQVLAGEMGWLRPFYVVAPERRRPALVEQAVRAREAGRPITLLTPQSRHDFVHVADVGAAAATAACHRLAGETEIGSGRLRSVRELVEALGVAWEASAVPAKSADVSAPHAHRAANVARLLDLGWSPTTTEELFPGD